MDLVCSNGETARGYRQAPFEEAGPVALINVLPGHRDAFPLSV